MKKLEKFFCKYAFKLYKFYTILDYILNNYDFNYKETKTYQYQNLDTTGICSLYLQKYIQDYLITIPRNNCQKIIYHRFIYSNIYFLGLKIDKRSLIKKIPTIETLYSIVYPIHFTKNSSISDICRTYTLRPGIILNRKSVAYKIISIRIITYLINGYKFSNNYKRIAHDTIFKLSTPSSWQYKNQSTLTKLYEIIATKLPSSVIHTSLTIKHLYSSYRAINPSMYPIPSQMLTLSYVTLRLNYQYMNLSKNIMKKLKSTSNANIILKANNNTETVINKLSCSNNFKCQKTKLIECSHRPTIPSHI